MTTPDSKQQLSVSQLNRLAKQLLEDCFAEVTVNGELSTLSRPSSGHWYFTLKDAKAQIRCAFFRNRNLYCKVQPQVGQSLQVKGKVSLYEGRGDYQLIVDAISLAGTGDLAAAFEALKQKLLAAGWFDAERKRPLPATIRHIAIITSATGAALQDVRAVLNKRWPAMRITLLPVLVQGEQAAPQIVQAIDRANRAAQQGVDFDLILLTRGGGSLEDLWAFNEEAVAAAIFHSALPVVSAIGHEVDFTISDFVADVRAATPSQAAELLSPDQLALDQRRRRLSQRAQRALQQTLLREQRALRKLQARILDPRNRLREQSQRLDELELRLQRQWQAGRRLRQQQLAQWQSRIALLNPGRRLAQRREQLQHLRARLQATAQQALLRQQQRHRASLQQLRALGPEQTLARGYAIVENPQRQIIRRSDQTQPGEALHLRLAAGSLYVDVRTCLAPDSELE